MDSVTEGVKWWVGGQLDGDGSVGLYNGKLRTELAKSVKALTTVHRFRDLFGGTVFYTPARHEYEEPMARWMLHGEKARLFCQGIVPYMLLKKDQFGLVSKITIGCNPIVATKGDVTTALENGAQLHRLIANPKIQWWTVCRRIKTSKPFELGGWSVTPLDKKVVKQRLSDAQQRLKSMKQADHAVITDQPPVSYFCGFFEADGCIYIDGPRSRRVQVAQKHRAICDAFASAYGGSVAKYACSSSTSGFAWRWYACSDNALAFLKQAEPFGYEKRAQMQLALSANAGNWQTNKKQMNAMKGARRKREREGLVAVSPNKQYRGTSEPTTPDVTDPL